MRLSIKGVLLVLVIAAVAPAGAVAAADVLTRLPDGRLEIDGHVFAGWSEYVQSDFFRATGRRCGTPPRWAMVEFAEARGAQADCTLSATTINPAYHPGDTLEIPVVVHIIRDSDGVTGELSDALVQSQIEILNEDFLALLGSNGAAGTYGGIRFVLATSDPDGDPTTGVTRSSNHDWFNDDENAFKPALVWDPARYLNIYTNNTSYLGYAYLPQSDAGQWWDGVVINYMAFGRDALGGPPYDQGRTATHEIGHYLGLLHTFAPEQPYACPSGNPSCYADDGDLLCDTEPEFSARFGCPTSPVSCETPDPIHNYMDYTDDLCMTEFTPEQVNRLRCSMVNYRPSLYAVVPADLIFRDGFESGQVGAWSSTAP